MGMDTAIDEQLGESVIMSADVERLERSISDAVATLGRKMDDAEGRLNGRIDKISDNVHSLRGDMQKISTTSALHEQSLENGRRAMEAHSRDIRDIMNKASAEERERSTLQQQIVLKVDKDALAPVMQTINGKADKDSVQALKDAFTAALSAHAKAAEDIYISRKQVIAVAIGFFLAGGGSVLAVLKFI